MAWDRRPRVRAASAVRRTRDLFFRKLHARSYYPVGSDCQIAQWDYLLELAFGCITNGVFVEVGANDGVSHSNTYGLAQVGWSGICIEPAPRAAQACRRNHAGHDVQVIEMAVSAPGVNSLTLTLAGELTSGSKETTNLYREMEWSKRHVTKDVVTVPCIPLGQLLASMKVPRDFNLLVVDVEGLEEDVFKGLDLDVYRPQVIAVELVDTHRDFSRLSESSRRVRQVIESAGYSVQYKDPVNTVFFRGW